MMLQGCQRLLRTARLLQCVGNVNSVTPPTYTIKRHFFFKYLNSSLNIYDRERFKMVGSDRLCAEWVLKCGGRLRWVGSDTWLSDYNSLPPESTKDHLNVQDIDVSGTVVMSKGFEHMWLLKHIKSVKLHMCEYVNDGCLLQLQFSNASLEQLQISSNKQITDHGLLHLVELVHLTDLHLKDLPGVKNMTMTYEKLQSALPNCDIICPDLDISMSKDNS